MTSSDMNEEKLRADFAIAEAFIAEIKQRLARYTAEHGPQAAQGAWVTLVASYLSTLDDDGIKTVVTLAQLQRNRAAEVGENVD